MKLGRTLAGLLAGLVLAAVAVVVLALVGRDDPQPIDATVAVPAEDAPVPDPAPAEVAGQDVPAEVPAEAAEEPAAEDAVPRFDLVRVAPGGQAVIAGAASGADRVRILLDGEVISEAPVDGRGQFATVVQLAASDDPRSLSLIGLAGEAEVASLETVIVSPVLSGGPETVVAGSGAEVPGDPGAAAREAVAAAGAEAVEEEGSAPVLLAGPDGVEVLQPAIAPGAGPDVLDSVALDAITYDDEGDVRLSGRAEEDGFVRVYVDNEPVETASVDADGRWRADLPEVDTGVYTLRIDEIGTEGEVVSRIETPFRRESPETVEAALDAVENSGDVVAPKLETVQAGGTLWAIAQSRYGDGFLYVKVFEANKDRIRNPDLIYPGQVFLLPE
ncbi:LysM peptidoglycan-binding domain-containing protein [Aestuariibius sp. 2305UL40-4]|uniref:LysM peptidoglycan-binding domain-containing protein n=1 Tax=Aestuariibius violaceus TaxID=3234132 RepID=UPI00345E660D